MWKSLKWTIGFAVRDMLAYSASVGLSGIHEDSALEYERKGEVHA